MKPIHRILVLMFLCLSSLSSCSDNDDPASPVFVRNASIMEEGQTLSPGDIVHLEGEGYLETDVIMLNIFWETGSEIIPEGALKGYRAKVVSRSHDGMTVQMPYRKPASRVEVNLMRQGEIMNIGKLYLSDGQTPASLCLYGINNCIGEQRFGDYMITRWLDNDKSQSDMKEWSLGVHRDFHSAVGIYRAYGICGLSKENDGQYPFFFDLYTNEWNRLSERNTIALFGNSSQIYAIQNADGDNYVVNCISSELEISNYATGSRASMPMPVPMQFPLPEGMTAGQFGDYPGAFSPSCVLLSANKGNGKWAPVLFFPKEGFVALDDIEAAALIPFSLYAVSGSGGDKYERIYGYIVVRKDSAEGDMSLFYSMNENMALADKPFATYPNQVLSASANNDRPETLTVHFKASRSGNVTLEYSFSKREWSLVGLFGTFDEIVWIN